MLLWPRISPPTSDPTIRETAARLQQRLRAVVEHALPSRPIDLRPEPERVCPRAGCVALSVGVMLSIHDGACVALALVSAPGQAPARLIPWAGRVRLRVDVVPFREPPEAQVTVEDFVACGDLLTQLNAHEGEVVAALRSAAGL